MPRFAHTKYKPAQDSSAELVDRATETGKVMLQTGGGLCPCGCGEKPKSKGRTFAMGHDAKLRGKLIRAHLMDAGVVHVSPEGETAWEGPAMALAEAHGWESALTEATRRREGKNLAVFKKAQGSKRLVKIGRWEYTGQVMAVYEANGSGSEEYLIEYVTRMGKVERVRVPAAEAKAVGA